MAHVRAATPGSTVDLSNCHPFAYDNYLLMHNGHIGGFRRLRRRLLEDLTDEAYGIIRGSTDTEHLFAIFVDEIVRHGCPVDAPGEGDATARPRWASRSGSHRRSSARWPCRRALATASPAFSTWPSPTGIVAVCRFASGDGAQPETLYLLHGELYPPAGRDFPQRRPTDEGEATVVASERLTTDARWQAVPANHMLVLDRWVRPRVLPMDASGRIAPAAVGV